ncbi:MAG: DMT family transporter [Gammaproteobacteria bacterium]|nr:DMT family transporter [Gammaproteobacteria bacterium]
MERSPRLSRINVVFLTVLAMIAFAGNSILCRIALKHTAIDAASFTSIRLMSGALVLWAITMLFGRERIGRGNWISAFALFVYAAGFSFSYISLTAATGALLLFGTVQVAMIGHGLWGGEKLRLQQLTGLVIAFAGLVGLLLPGLSAPPLVGSVLMMIAGVAWAVYTLRGKGAGDPTRVTAGNFRRASLFAAILSLLFISNTNLDTVGVWYAIASGALTSGLGYAVWYSVVPALKSTNAATVQLSVPVIAALGGIVLLSELVTMRFVLASIATLGGIALVILSKPRSNN